MLRRLIGFELRYHARQIIFPASIVAFFVLGLALASSGFGAPNVPVNAPSVIALSLGLLSLGGIFLATAFCANAALRDTEHDMAEIVEATGADPRSRLVARFTGAFAASLLVLTVAAIGMSAVCLAPWVDATRLGPIRLMPYASALLTLVVPNVFFVTALVFTVATLTRSQAGTWVGALFVFVMYLTVATVTDSPLIAGSTPSSQEAMATAALFDPFGLSAYFAQTLFWTPSERETRLVALSGPLLLNRLVWTAASVIVLGLAVFGPGRRIRVRAVPGVGGAPNRRVRPRRPRPRTGRARADPTAPPASCGR